MRRTFVGLATATLLVVQVVLLAVAVRGSHVSGHAPKLPVTPPANPTEALTIETALPIADPVAKSWNHDAVLVSALMEIVWPQDEVVVVPSAIADGGAMTLVYAAGDAQLSLLMDRRSGVIFHADQGAWSDELDLPLPVAGIVRSAAIAVLAAEVSYGTSYRASCPDYRYVTRVYLSRSTETAGDPVWLVSYVDDRHRDRPDIQIAVDAVTGKTVGGQATPPSCDEG